MTEQEQIPEPTVLDRLNQLQEQSADTGLTLYDMLEQRYQNAQTAGAPKSVLLSILAQQARALED